MARKQPPIANALRARVQGNYKGSKDLRINVTKLKKRKSGTGFTVPIPAAFRIGRHDFSGAICFRTGQAPHIYLSSRLKGKNGRVKLDNVIREVDLGPEVDLTFHIEVCPVRGA
jgi:hypothetical protein